MDFNASVREHVVLMLSDWLTNLPDRYDYETRLLPYLLNALTDSAQVDIYYPFLSQPCSVLYTGKHSPLLPL